MFKIIKNKDRKLCKAYKCKNPRAGKTDRFCSKHRHRFRKENDIVAYTYNLRKSRAKQRGHSFTITLEEFRKWCAENDYIDKKGKKAGSASIDRKDDSIGYTYDNMQILSLSDNSAKQHKDACPF